MADLAVLERRLSKIVAARRPDISDERRAELVRAVVDGLCATDDLTRFWMTLYESLEIEGASV